MQKALRNKDLKSIEDHEITREKVVSEVGDVEAAITTLWKMTFKVSQMAKSL